MIFHAEGGTDGAMMGIFWPAYLPKEPSTELQDDPVGFIEELDGKGRLINLPCDGDGGYRISVYVDESPPADHMAFYKQERSYPEVRVEGPTFYGGLEFIFEHNVGAEGENYIGECETLDLPEGAYALEVYATTFNRAQRDKLVTERTGWSGKLVPQFEKLFFILGFFAVLIGPLSLIVLYWNWMALWTLAASVLVFLLIFVSSKTPPFTQVNKVREDIAVEYPHYLVIMRKKDGQE